MKNIEKLILLHSNDLHGDFLEEKVDNLDIGGVSMLSGYINKIREEEKNVLYVIAGDMFRGSVIDSEFRGISTIEIMNLLSPDIVTIGNHEIDYGISHLLFIEKCAQFPIINANLYIKTNGTRLFTPYKIIRMNDMKILFIGIITESIIAQARAEGLVGSFINTAEAAVEIGKICNAYYAIDIDFTVILTHIGIEEDIELAKNLKPEWGVDIIIGGHSHTFLDKPILENGIIIAHAGEGTDNVGRFDIDIDIYNNCIDSYTWNFIPINHNTAEKDIQLEEMINKYKNITDRKYQRIITRFNRALTHPQRNIETSLGRCFADIFKKSLGIDIMLLGSGSIRGQKLGPIVEYGNLLEVFPYDDSIHMIKLNGNQLKDMIKFILREESFLGTTEFYQFSEGLKFKYSKTKKDLVEIFFNGEELKDNDLYTIGLQKFHFNNIEDFLNISYEELEKNQRPRIISTSSFDILVEFLSYHYKYNYNGKKRMIIVE